MAIDDPDIQPFLNFDTVDSNKENSKPSGNIKTSSQVNHMEEDFDDEDGGIKYCRLKSTVHQATS
jgi:hypothetical protein